MIFITQGIGEDGHTAGMMPYPEDPALFQSLFVDTDRWVVGYDAEAKNTCPKRVTATIPFLRNIVSESIVFMCGSEKRAALERVVNREGTVAKTPALILHEMKSVHFFTDIAR